MTRFAPGEIINGKYRLEAELGGGGQGKVFQAWHVDMDTEVALKVLFDRSEESVRRFRQEARLAAKLRHPNIVKILDFGLLDDGEPYMVMERLRGAPLDALLLRNGPLHRARALKLFIPCLEGLADAHAHGIVHKDLKPSNLFVVDANTDRELMVILDFGIARHVEGQGKGLTISGGPKSAAPVGTPHYMAPEYLEGLEATPAVDVYQMGLILAEALSGQVVVNPVESRNSDIFMPCFMAHLTEGRVHDAIPEVVRRDTALGPIVFKATNFKAADRYADAAAFAHALRDAKGADEKLSTGSWGGFRDDPIAALLAAPSLATLHDAQQSVADTGAHERLRQALEGVLQKDTSPDLTVAVNATLARLLEEDLGDIDGAANHWTRVAIDAPQHPEAQRALTRIYSSCEDWGRMCRAGLMTRNIPLALNGLEHLLEASPGQDTLEVLHSRIIRSSKNPQQLDVEEAMALLNKVTGLEPAPLDTASRTRSPTVIDTGPRPSAPDTGPGPSSEASATPSGPESRRAPTLHEGNTGELVDKAKKSRGASSAAAPPAQKPKASKNRMMAMLVAAGAIAALLISAIVVVAVVGGGFFDEPEEGDLQKTSSVGGVTLTPGDPAAARQDAPSDDGDDAEGEARQPEGGEPSAQETQGDEDAPRGDEGGWPVETLTLNTSPVQVGLDKAALEALHEAHPEQMIDLEYGVQALMEAKAPRVVAKAPTSLALWRQRSGELQGTACGELGGEDAPGEASGLVVGVGASEAAAFCELLGMRLPSATEWEAAMRGEEGEALLESTGQLREWVRCDSKDSRYCREGVGVRGGFWNRASEPPVPKGVPSRDVRRSVFGTPPGGSMACLKHSHVGFRCVADTSSP